MDGFVPFEFARHQKRVSGSFSIAELGRLRSVLAREDDALVVQFSMTGCADVADRFFLRVVVHVDALPQVCQRCLDVVDVVVDSEVKLFPVEDDVEAKFVEGFEPLLVDEDGLCSLVALVEDEVLLSLPGVSFHAEDVCFVSLQAVNDAQRKVAGPFQKLAELKF